MIAAGQRCRTATAPPRGGHEQCHPTTTGKQPITATSASSAGTRRNNDPLLQGRNFSYLDTQLNRLGSPNFTHLAINASAAG